MIFSNHVRRGVFHPRTWELWVERGDRCELAFIVTDWLIADYVKKGLEITEPTRVVRFLFKMRGSPHYTLADLMRAPVPYPAWDEILDRVERR